MTHSTALATGLTANGIDLTRSDLRILCRITSGLYGGLDYRGVDTTIPARAGRIPMPRKADMRTIVAEGSLFGAGANELVQRADLAATLADLDGLMRSDQEPYEIEATLLDGTTATIMARPTGFDPIEGPVPTYMTVRLEWVSVDPDWVVSEPAVAVEWCDTGEVTAEWEPLAAVASGDRIVVDGYVWEWTTPDGTTGASLPAFDLGAGGGGTQPDGDGQWGTYSFWAAETSYGADTTIQPTAGNGHLYHTDDGGMTGTDEPTWPIDDSCIEDPLA